MFIFRFEHNRDVCMDAKYGKGGDSETGHGPASGSEAGCYTDRPNFGRAGATPSIRMVEYERCSVTAQQFSAWIGMKYDYSCQFTTSACQGGGNCYLCPSTATRALDISPDWDIIAYWVEDESEGIDWREDNNQIIFNPSYAQRIGTVQLWEIEQLAGVKIPLFV